MEPSLSPGSAALDWRHEFPVLDELVFLNHAAVAPLPARAAEALRTYADEACRMGGAAWPRWAGRLKQARHAAAALLGTTEEEIGFVHNTTHGLICLAQSLPWRPGDNIVSAEHEFPADVYPWRNLAERGVSLRAVPERPDRRFRVEDFLAWIDSRTRMVAISLVQYSTGFRMPVEALAQVCRERGILLCLDAIQAVGAMPTRPQELGCDFLVADGHKWLLSPEGAGILYVRKDRLSLFNDSMTGWTARVRPQDYDDTEQPVQESARRFEEGAVNVPGTLALGASLGLFLEVGIEEVWRRIRALTDQLVEGLNRLDCTVVSPRGEGEASGIVAFEPHKLDPMALVKQMEQEGIHVTARRGWVRVSPHFYNQPGQIERFLEVLGRALAGKETA